MSTLKLCFLGPSRIELDGAECKLARRKALGLLAYLAVTAQPHSRDALAELLFPRLTRSRSRSCLRQTLSVLRAQLGEDWLSSDRGAISLASRPELWVDVHAFRGLAEEARRKGAPSRHLEAEAALGKAAELCRGEFLSGFYLRDSPAFEDWETGEQERMREECGSVLEDLSARRGARGDFAEAIECARKWLSLDPLEEAAHRRLMELYSAAGHRAAALKQYSVCRALLSKELGAEPESETEALRGRIVAGEMRAVKLAKPAKRPAGGANPATAPRVGRRDVVSGRHARTGEPPPTLESRFRPFLEALPASLQEQLMSPDDGETRLVTVLVAEVLRAHTGDTLTVVLRDLVNAFTRYGGRIGSVRANEAVAVFGSPSCHEGDAQRAVLAALEARDKANGHQVEVAVGIATGYMCFDPRGAEAPRTPHPDPSVRALAERLKRRACPGEIVIGERTHRSVRRCFELALLPSSAQSNREELNAYRVDGRRSRFEEARGLEGLQGELVGRAQECAVLDEVLTRLWGGAGQMVSIVGEAGVGKSRLVSELRKRLMSAPRGAAPPRWLEGQCLELAVAAGYWPFIEMLGRHLGFEAQQPEEVRARLLFEELERLDRSGSVSSERHEELAPLLGKLLSIRVRTVWDSRLAHAQPEQIRHQTVLAIRDLLLALCTDRPLVVVLEDVHWADSLSMDALSLLMESLTLAPLLLVCTYRPEPDQRSLQLAAVASRKCPERYTEIALRELSTEEGRRLIASLLPADVLTPRIRDAILAQSQGNPFFVEEVVRSLIDAGVLYREGDRWRARGDAPDMAVPESVQNVILGRVDRLETRLRQVLESASVIGRIFHREILERAAVVERETEGALAELEARALITVDRSSAHEGYSFKHALTQQAVYQSIVQRRRTELHERIAQAIETLHTGSLEDYCLPLAFHYAQAGNKEKAVEYLLAAGERAVETHMNEAALGHFERALALLGSSTAPPDRSRVRLLTAIGRVHEVMGEHSLAETRLREAAELGERLELSPGERGLALFFLCKTLSARHRPQEYVPIAREVLALLGPESASPETLMMEFVVAYGSFDEGDFAALCDYAERRKERIRTIPYSLDNTNIATYLAWAYLIAKNEPEAMDWLQWSEAQARTHNDLVCLAATYVRRGRDMLARRGDASGALAALGEAARLYQTMGARYLEVRCHLCLGDIHYRYGRLGDAEACCRRAEELCADLPHHAHLGAEQRLLRGQIALGLEDTEAAASHFEAALSASPGKQWECYLRFLIGRTLLAQGRKEEAAARLLELLESTPEFRVPPAYYLTVNFGRLLSLLEECYEDPKDFRADCELARAERSVTEDLHWYLEPALPRTDAETLAWEDFHSPLGASWKWTNPYEDCSFEVGKGLVISAAVGRGLEGTNLGAPRLVRVATGDLALQAACEAVESDGPVTAPRADPPAGGLVLWKDESNYLRLDQGVLAHGHVSFGGCIGNRDFTAGRGRLGTDRMLLRLERTDGGVRALASADGDTWHLVGTVAFPFEDRIEVGVFADGAIRPEVYLRAFSVGSTIRFTDLRLSRLGSQASNPS